MPKETLSKVKVREFKTLKRFDVALKSSKVLKTFFDKGFKNYDAFSAIVLHYNPELSEKRLWDFWHFRVIDEDICEKLTAVFEKLNNE